MQKQRYTGKDYSSNWKVVNYEGKTLVVIKDGKSVTLTGFDGYKSAAKEAAIYSGNPVRE